MKCIICLHDAELAFNATILKKYDIQYHKCNSCSFLFTEKPFWLEEAYSYAIANADTGLIRRSFVNSLQVLILLHSLGLNVKQDKFLDYAGGGGILVRLMRDLGLDFYWNDKFCINWVANGFEGNLEQKYDAITSFESFEHFVDPIHEIGNLLNASDTLIFSTELIPTRVPDKSWWYYSFETGQHIAFYSIETFEYIAHKYNVNYYCFDNIHVLSKRNISAFRQKIIAFLIKKRGLNFIFALLYSIYIKARTRLASKISSDNSFMLQAK